jgi:Ca2+-binding EF-hand superfamily protein
LFFCLWDEDGDGFLSEQELVLMMPVDLIEMKFRTMVKKKIDKENTSLQGIFRFFDKDGEGKISCDEFVAGCQVLQLGILDSQAAALFKNWDVDNGGTIEFEEFKKCMKKE